ncbi:MAG TPA: ABC-F family ATP-binding cassette domain-containing protein [Gaiellaceae bacterium]|nr:ABC-F family ATP-binding cassette domain-containing protein [Gaiellaceae bacterium]
MQSHSITLVDVTVSHGADEVFSHVSLTVGAGSRIGVVGPNGVGKTTLLRLLAGLDEPERGRVRTSPPGLSVGYLPQERELGNLSGGQAARGRLAELFRADHDVYCLDEPTNDLDFEGLEWLERAVQGVKGSVVLVSHDREFLDRTVARIVELEEGRNRLREWPGGWSEYEAARSHARERQYRRYEESDERRRDIESLLRARRGQARAHGRGADRRGTQALKSKVRQAERALERVEQVEKPFEPWELHLELQPTGRGGELVVRLEGAVVERGRFRLGPVDLDVYRGDRFVVAGRNGSGKSTLLGALTGAIPLTAGRRQLGTRTVLGELEQARERFAVDAPLVEAFGGPQREARTLLAKFGLGADDVLRPARTLSPGERTRAELALLSARGVNCLILDEPTNHLDLPAIEELEAALAGYPGTIVLVTHDRRLLETFRPTQTIELDQSRETVK